jgi:hypothetical protein
VLIFKADPRQKSEPNPKLLISGFDDADQHVCATRPEQHLERVHRIQVVNGEKSRRHENGQGGQNLRKALTSQIPGNDAGNQDFRCSC